MQFPITILPQNFTEIRSSPPSTEQLARLDKENCIFFAHELMAIFHHFATTPQPQQQQQQHHGQTLLQCLDTFITAATTTTTSTGGSGDFEFLSEWIRSYIRYIFDVELQNEMNDKIKKLNFNIYFFNQKCANLLFDFFAHHSHCILKPYK
jgi:hypothetical protein